MLVQFCGCPMIAAPHSPADHAQPSGKRREVTVKGKRTRVIDIHAHCCVPKAMAVIGHPLEAPGLLDHVGHARGEHAEPLHRRPTDRKRRARAGSAPTRARSLLPFAQCLTA